MSTAVGPRGRRRVRFLPKRPPAASAPPARVPRHPLTLPPTTHPPTYPLTHPNNLPKHPPLEPTAPDVSQPLPGAHLVVCNLEDHVIRQAPLEAKCPTTRPSCNSKQPPQAVRSLHLRSKRRVGNATEMRVAWGLPPGEECVTSVSRRA